MHKLHDLLKPLPQLVTLSAPSSVGCTNTPNFHFPFQAISNPDIVSANKLLLSISEPMKTHKQSL
jgi:hypothetical protein